LGTTADPEQSAGVVGYEGVAADSAALSASVLADVQPIEWVWLDLHARAGRNHRCQTMQQLLGEVGHHFQHGKRTIYPAGAVA
jgi:hypothetical protein